MAKVTIDKVDYEIPPLKFAQLKRVWPLMQSVGRDPDPMSNAESILGIIAEGLSKTGHPMTVEEIEEKLDAAEFPPLEQTMTEIMAEAGLVVVKAGEEAGTVTATGEASPPAEESPSTETGTDISPSLSPPESVAETGTE